MWPKALLQLLELVPHFSRLLPMADKFFQTKATLDDTTLKTMADLRGELGQANASHTGLYRQMNEQSEKLANISADVTATKAEVSVLEARLAQIEATQKKQNFYLLCILLLVLVMAISLPLLLKSHR